jgi:hypothetical protein
VYAMAMSLQGGEEYDMAIRHACMGMSGGLVDQKAGEEGHARVRSLTAQRCCRAPASGR